MSTSSSVTKLEALLKTQPGLWRGRDQHNDYASVSTGFAQLDKALPSGGWGIGCLTELLLEQRGIGEFSLLLPGLHQVTTENQWAALVNPPYVPYAPALANAGINLERLLIINTDNDTDTLWATEQLLRAGIFASVIAWVNRTTAQKQRRLQLAAELGKTWATVYRPVSAKDEHSPAALRMVVRMTQEAAHEASHESSHVGTHVSTHVSSRGTPSMSLEIIKSRAGKNHCVHITPSQFDNPQGAQWPVMPTGINTNKKAANITARITTNISAKDLTTDSNNNNRPTIKAL